ncbi:MAG: hypothetical protein D6736_06885 [Nitrospinota bacterium]|nr:MAG: hypothetical protein D6736_06885 [Nitrospinota bacterium]
MSHALIREIQSQGIKVLTKSLGSERDNPQYWGKLFDLGIDIILTDHPTKMMHYLKQYPLSGLTKPMLTPLAP